LSSETKNIQTKILVTYFSGSLQYSDPKSQLFTEMFCWCSRRWITAVHATKR